MRAVRVKAWPLALVLAVAAGACAPSPATTSRARPPATASAPSPGTPVLPASSPRASVSPLPAATAMPHSPSPLASPPVVASPTAAGVTLAGTVSAPATLLSDHGAAFALLDAPAEVPAAGITIALLDAAGQPLSAGGKALTLTATTDAQGHYAFTQTLPDGPLVLSAALGGSRGALVAILPQGAVPASRRVLATPPRVDLDLASTLSSTYVLVQDVRSQADPAGTLAKLTPTLEADTRSKTAAAVAAGHVPVPDALTDARVVSTVEALRQADGALDNQLQTVRCALVEAGQCDLGNGRPATQVALGFIGALLPAPDGTLYVATADRRIWRLRTDGTIVTVAGKGSGDAAVMLDVSLTGTRATDAELTTLQGIALDAKGRLLILESTSPLLPTQRHRVSRLELDGTLTELWSNKDWPAGEAGAAIGASTGDEVLVLTSGGLYAIAADQTRQKRLSLSASDGQFVAKTAVAGRDARGRFLLSAAYDPTIYRFDPTGDGHLEVLSQGAGNVGTAVDAAGDVFTLTGSQLTVARSSGASPTTLLDVLPAAATTNGYPFNLNMFFTKGVALMPDGSAYVGQQYLLYHVQHNQLLLAAGTQGATTGQASDVALQEPSGVAVTADGSLLVADSGNHRLLRVGTDQAVSVVAGTGTRSLLPADHVGAALQAQFMGPWAVHLDAAGTIYLADSSDLLSLTGGQLLVRYHSAQSAINQFAVAADGTLYFAELHPGGRKLQRLAAGAMQPETLEDLAHRAAEDTVGVDAAGTLYVMGNGTLRSWTRADGFKTVATDARLPDSQASLAVDAKGRFYFPDTFEESATHILRLDPATGQITPIAGSGTSLFAGGGVDQSLSGVTSLTFNAAGDLVFGDFDHKQVKRIPAAQL